MRLSPDAYLGHLRAESDRFRAVLAGGDPGARVPACPDWSTADLLQHLTQVQTFWSLAVEGRPAEPPDEPLPRADSHAAMLADSAAATDRLITALGAADPDEEAWTWSSEHRVGFVQRRQVHEVTIHRVDAEQTAGLPSLLDPVVAADAVLETLEFVFGDSPGWGRFAPSGARLRVDAVDAGTSIWVELGRFTGTDPGTGTAYDEPDLRVTPDPGRAPDVVVAGPAGALDTWLWRRTDDTGITVAGDRTAYDHFRAVVDHPIT